MESDKIKEYQAIGHDKQGKPKTIFIIYTATKKRAKYQAGLDMADLIKYHSVKRFGSWRK